MSERRYTEEEMAAIFEQASKVEPGGAHQLQRREGMTLAELQVIGTEAGIPAEHVAVAARHLDQMPQRAARSMLGLPIGVGRTVVLDRRLSEDDWDRLVVELRQTFDARGTVRVDGSFRQWTNGNLQVLVEPWGQGQRVRMRTRNANAQGFIFAGSATLAMTAIIAIGTALDGSLTLVRTLLGVTMLGSMGLGVLGLGALRLPRWARTRQEQMDAIAERLLKG